MKQAAVPLWGSKNEVVAPKWRTQNTFFGLVLELVLKFAILVLNISTKMAFSQNTFAMPLGTNCTQMAFCQNTFMWRAPKWQSSEHVWVWVIFWCQDGSRPYLIGSYDGAFHKDSKSGLNSKMVIGTQIGFTQNRAELSYHLQTYDLLICKSLSQGFQIWS